MPGFATYIPVGPTACDMFRAIDLINSLLYFEPEVRAIVVIDHGVPSFDGCEFIKQFHHAPIQIVRHNWHTSFGTWLGTGMVTNLVALGRIFSRIDVDVVIKLDTDALVIGPFYKKLMMLIGSDSRVGICGTLHASCNEAMRTDRFDAETLKQCAEAAYIEEKMRLGKMLENYEIVRWNLFNAAQRSDFQGIAKELEVARGNGFDGSHCQGGAYAITAAFIEQVHRMGYADNPLRFLYFPVGEDRMMGAYCAALGLQLKDMSGIGEVFGVQSSRLPFAPDELVQRNYSIIHSVRGNQSHSEDDIRGFFAARRGRVGVGGKCSESQLA